VARVEQHGMASLFPPEPPTPRQSLPSEIGQAIRELKAEYPPFRANQLATICATGFGRRPSPHTVKRLLAEEPTLVGLRRRFPPHHQIADAAERRLVIIRLHAEGWNIKSIAGYLGIDRHTVYATLRRWIDEGVLGLDDKSHARNPGGRKVDLRAMLAVRELQENPELGEFRIHWRHTTAGSLTSTTKCTGRIGSARTAGTVQRRCSAGCIAGRWTQRNSTASSMRRASGAH
jgi:hypothetical protein